MIFLVPISPEVPPQQKPRLWQGLLVILCLGIIYLQTEKVFDQDLRYILGLQTISADSPLQTDLGALENFLKKRPLLTLSPSKGDWDIRRLVIANFLHEGQVHLFLNMIGVFAGMRLCSTFIPFALSLSIFILGGSLGLLSSMLLSTEPSQYIPHVGASAGLFALMGTYYLYNLRYRTRYFFWFPSRRGFISLKTSWFFFLDALLLELILSLAQLFPSRVDSVDHLAHVVGFASGLGLALFFRVIQRWPEFIQTRTEFLHWSRHTRRLPQKNWPERFDAWADILAINPYNDQLKLRLYWVIQAHINDLSDEQIARGFSLLSPTFIRLQTEASSFMIRRVLEYERPLPEQWLKSTPYDSIIRIAKFLATPNDTQDLLLRFVTAYRRAHSEGGDIERKLELLTRKLNGIVQTRENGAFSTRPEDVQRAVNARRNPRG